MWQVRAFFTWRWHMVIIAENRMWMSSYPLPFMTAGNESFCYEGCRIFRRPLIFGWTRMRRRALKEHQRAQR